MNIGDKVVFDEYSTVGYIVKIEIDPISEFVTDFQTPEEFATYTIRVFKPFYVGGYTDFQRSRDDLTPYRGIKE